MAAVLATRRAHPLNELKPSVTSGGTFIRPSTTMGEPWLVLTAPCKVFESTRHSGKWLIPKGDDAVDGAWIKVLGLVSSGALLCAKVSTRRSRLLGGYPEHVICVYTRDWRDYDDVMEVREVLRAAGFAERLRYKRDLDTYEGVEQFTYVA